MYIHTHKNIHADRLACPPGYLRGACSCSCAYSTSACNSSSVQSDRRTATAAALEDEEARFATLPIFHCAVLSPRGRRPRQRQRANGMTMPRACMRPLSPPVLRHFSSRTVSTSSSYALRNIIGNGRVLVGATRGQHLFPLPFPLHIQWGPINSLFFVADRATEAQRGTIKLAVLPGV